MTAKVLAIQETPLYSLAHLTLISATVPELIYIAARAGYDAVSPRLIPMHVDGEFTQSPVNRAQVQAAKTALSTTGLKVLDIELARITEDCDPRSFERALELGGELGAKRMIMSAWTPTRDDRNFLVDVYGETCDLAEPYGLTVDLEFPSFSRLRTLDEALDIVRAADRPNGGILVDTLYLHLSRVDIGELLHVPSDLLHFLHISDCLPGIADTREGMIQLARDARLYPGEGWIDFAGIIERMPPVDYSIELPNTARIAELGYEEHARRCLQHAKQKFGAVRSQRRAADLVHLQFKEESYGQRAH
ncbi:sugar phosphate isomerase/epimerase [Labrenzia sp. EL_208]|uniref:sugar phosphate isomerase/epimerase family protein n=1 Tax=Roseibium album TaxID=311410 RepID=UPI000CF149FE|nr:sugar phosphate isomerase/epimerase [Roseibium album]MBG6144917.1 sugar phosphate isomerase/epimerase [Labrenzia sp. EL_142]MBG6156868.1 sugar phosphate isomerase/epimerase [Labrenzia sp. EL_162]MBG6163520.1 sugar phosphate isomerase/epimerase [Labrenzia sp. EL_195]MBG6173054.1 sugar phosphate isomerase/epimerase [Labrenzia sp. EL_132]MBG6195192.1 sugar phosphate isomerase/epimerase [Labrenzia sp. EL_159]MBG6203228.1 sugar phosphate isomerase/epimerase [Labrenzia sp. EL_13]MBG6209741.1 su